MAALDLGLEVRCLLALGISWCLQVARSERVFRPVKVKQLCEGGMEVQALATIPAVEGGEKCFVGGY